MSEIEDLKKKIKRLEDLEISKAMCCCENELKLQKAVSVLNELLEDLKKGSFLDE